VQEAEVDELIIQDEQEAVLAVLVEAVLDEMDEM